MAEATVDRLQIEVSASADSGAKSFGSYIDALKELKGMVTKTSPALSSLKQELGDSSGFGALKSNISKTVRAVKTALSALLVRSWIKESNDYVENLNLFSVAMGDYAKSAERYADTVSEVMGIDPSAWMRNQGVFMTLATGFGVASESAATMSKNLTQLGYDISSFFNISVGDAMEKLQSGISGELEPLRRLGYDLSQARLEALAMANGIDKSVSSMTQAEKAQLRYVAIMTQVTSAQGDMARTLEAPANQLRIFEASVVQAQRALGNMFIPALNALIPYAIAVANAVRYAAQSIANFLGFSLPEIDYSGLDGIASAGDSATGALEDTTKAAKKLKNAVVGIDELNIISPNASSGSGAGSGFGSDLGLNLDQYSYDFLGDAVNSKVERITNALTGFLDKAKAFLPKIEPLVTGIVGSLLLLKGAGILKSILSAVSVLPVVGPALVSTASALAEMNHPLDAAVSGWRAFSNGMKNLSPIGKATVSLAAFGAEAITVYKAVKDATTGEISFTTALLNVAPAIAVGTVALGTMFGPLGVVASAFVTAASAVVGWNAAQNNMREAMVEAAFFDGQGVAIADLSNGYIDLIDSVTSAQQPIIDSWQAIQDGRVHIDNAANSVNMMVWEVENGAATIPEYVNEISKELNSIYDNTLTSLTQERDLIYAALAGSLGDAVAEAGALVPEFAAQIGSLYNQTTVELERLKIAMDEALSIGDVDAFSEAWGQYQKHIKDTDSTASEFTKTLENLVPKDINWETDDLTGVFDSVAGAVEAAKESIQLESNATIEALTNWKQRAEDLGLEDIAISIGDLIKIEEDSVGARIEEIEGITAQYLGTLQTDLIESVNAEVSAAMEEWDALSPLVKAFKYDNNQYAYVEDALSDYRDNIVSPTIQKMKDAFGEEATKNTLWADSAMQTIIDNLFSADVFYDNSKSDQWAGTFVGNIKKSIESVVPKDMGDAAKNTINGFAEGITNNIGTVTSAGNGIGNAVTDSLAENLDMHSPSKVMHERGVWTVQGFVDGVTESTTLVSDAIGSMVDESMTVSVEREFKGLLNSMKSSADTFVNAIKQNNIKVVNDIKEKVRLVSADISSELSGLKSEIVSTMKSATDSTAQMFQSMANRSVSAIDRIISALDDIPRSITTVHTVITEYEEIGGSGSIAGYATGGFPAAGQLFYARESGPELVGTIGGSPAVVNNDQIVEAVSAGVASAVAAVLGAGGSNEANVSVYLDGEKIYSNQQKVAARRGYNISLNPSFSL